MDLFIYLFVNSFFGLNLLCLFFVGLTQDDILKEAFKISLWTAINVFIILIVSFFIGQYVFFTFGIILMRYE
jgi:multiple antibiotic resistance protein